MGNTKFEMQLYFAVKRPEGKKSGEIWTVAKRRTASGSSRSTKLKLIPRTMAFLGFF